MPKRAQKHAPITIYLPEQLITHIKQAANYNGLSVGQYLDKVGHLTDRQIGNDLTLSSYNTIYYADPNSPNVDASPTLQKIAALKTANVRVYNHQQASQTDQTQPKTNHSAKEINLESEDIF